LLENQYQRFYFIIGSPFHASKTSPFYDACRANDIDLVEKYMESMSVEEINQIEPNGPTALHVPMSSKSRQNP
jgi:hypothetical protein